MIDDDFICHGEELEPLPEISFGAYALECLKGKDENFITVIEAETGLEFTTKELTQNAVNIATGMRNLGITKGDTICIIGRNGFDVTAAGLGAIFIGAILTPLDISNKAFEFQHMFGLVDPKLVICDSDLIGEIKKGLEMGNFDVPIYTIQEEVEGTLLFSTIAVENDMESFEAEPCDDVNDICLIVGSSGSTGLPKAVALTHENLLYQATVGKKMVAMFPAGTFIQTSHFFWISSVFMMILSFCFNMTRILIREIEDLTVMQAIESYKPIWTLMPPSLLNSIIHHPEVSNYDLSSLLVIVTGGSPLQRATAEAVKEKLGKVMVAQGYGLSEVGGPFTAVRPDFDVSCVGGMAAGTSIKVINVETGAHLPPEEEGEICCKSLGLMKGYLKNEAATAECIDQDGWFHTGDLGYYTSNCELYCTGRMKELMKLDNHQIAPAEIEQVINAVPGVADVGVAGIKISEDSSHPMALVVKEAGSDVSEEEIIKSVNENLSEHKQLRAGVCFVEAIPRNASGKIVRRLLQEMAKELYMGDTQSIF